MTTHQKTPQELRVEIEATRRELGATVEQLAAKTAVRARLLDFVAHVKGDLQLTLEGHPVRTAAIGGAGIALLIGLIQFRRTD